MTPLAAPALSEMGMVLCALSILLIPFAIAGLSLINTGLGRSRSAAHLMMSSLCVVAVAALTYFVCGFAWQGIAGYPSHVLTVGGRKWSWIATMPLFFRGVGPKDFVAPLIAWAEVFSVGLAALIPLGSGSDRWRLGASCISTILLAGWTYPLFAHWVWGGGWLAQLGVNYGLGHGFVDAGGSSSIQAVGGLTALAIAWILGARKGKYSPNSLPTAIPGHNAVYVLFGCLLALVGWLGLNSAGAILFTGAEPSRVPMIAINTILAAAAAALSAVVITRARFGKPDASLSANSWVGGLVASSAGCAFITAEAAVVTGIITGALVVFAVQWFDLRLVADDPGGAISVHAVGGIWGVVALGLFAHFAGQTVNGVTSSSPAPSGQWLAQLVGVATLLGFILPMTYGLNWVVDCIYPQRVAVEGEMQGMDLFELGAGAYPEFVTHSEDFVER